MEIPNPLEPKLNQLNTACERINYAMKRIAEKGWMQNRLRPWKRVEGIRPLHAVAGPACLLGSLITDEELAQLEQVDQTDAVYNLTLPGLYEAVQALEFGNAHSMWQWNDQKGRTADVVLERLQTGKVRACV